MTDNTPQAQPDTLSEEVEKIVREVIQRRERGEAVSDQQVLAQHPEISTALQPALDALGAVERASLLARLAHQSSMDFEEPHQHWPQVPGYVLLRELASGGQANVYLGRGAESTAFVAIKLLSRRKFLDTEDRRRFIREVNLLQDLDHPQVVRVLDHGETARGELFLVMNYVDGGPLDIDHLRREWSTTELIFLFMKICDAVNAAHCRGILHRDLKPANIRVDRAGRPHVLDFGLATHIDPSIVAKTVTTRGEFVGTFAWASPEQRRGNRMLSAASDVYSLGILLYQLVTGKFPPHVVEAFAGLLENRDPRRLTSLPDVADGRLARIIKRCLSENPSARFPDAGALAASLRESVLLPGHRRQRRRGLAGLVAAGPCIAAIFAGMMWTVPTRSTPTFNGRQVLATEIQVFCWIPAGEFIIGAVDHDLSALPDERPPRRIVIPRGFYMGTTEVTQAAYESIMGRSPSLYAGAARPVENVTYHEAVEFCRVLSARWNRRVRLPTEQEWEYACRAGTRTIYHFGDDPREMLRYGNVADASLKQAGVLNRMSYDDGAPQTRHVGAAISNPWYLYDMHGNVWEWCQAPYLQDPSDASTALPELAAARGGCWWDTAPSARASNRNPLRLDARAGTLGFRIVMEE